MDCLYGNIKQAKSQTHETPISLKNVLQSFEKLVSEPEFKNILNCFEPCSKSLENIKRIHADATNKGQSKRRRILDVMHSSSLAFCSKSINISGHVEHQFDVDNQEHSMKYDDFSELRDRARLIAYSNNKIKNDTDRETEDLHMFITLVDTIETILNTLTSLDIAGHPSVRDFLHPKKKFTCIEGKFQDLVKLNEELDNLLKNGKIMCVTCIKIR